jgi:hypothetical protein
VFPFGFKTDNASELTVTRRNAAGTEIVETPGVNYTVSLNADQQNSPGGTVTRTPALPTGETLTISSRLAFTQGVDLVNLGGFFPDIIEGALDRVTLLAQQVNDNLTRTIRVPITDGLAGTLTLPTAVARANKTLVFDATGTPVAGDTSPVYLPTIPSQAGNTGRFLSTDGTNTVWNPVSSIPGTFALTGDISPAQLTANTDNWAPTGLSGASVIRASTDASRNLTGLTGGANGRTMRLLNVGAQPLVLMHDVTSTAANRFLCPGNNNFTLGANSGCDLTYDSISSRWRVVEQAAPPVSGSDKITTLTFTTGPSGTSPSIIQNTHPSLITGVSNPTFGIYRFALAGGVTLDAATHAVICTANGATIAMHGCVPVNLAIGEVGVISAAGSFAMLNNCVITIQLIRA